METKNETINPTDTREFVITRELKAPRDLVFKAWSEADRLAKWWGPKGFNLEVAKFDFQPEGIFHYSMQAGDGPKMWGKFVYREIAAPEKIVFINSFSDENATITRAPFADTWPEEMMNILTLKEQDGKTLLTLRGAPINATEEETNTYHAHHESMRQGFGGTFEQLEAYLAEEQQNMS